MFELMEQWMDVGCRGLDRGKELGPQKLSFAWGFYVIDAWQRRPRMLHPSKLSERSPALTITYGHCGT